MKNLFLALIVTIATASSARAQGPTSEILTFETFEQIIKSLRAAGNNPTAVAAVVSSYSGRAARVAKSFAEAFATRAAAVGARANAAAILPMALIEREYIAMLPGYMRERYDAVRNECSESVALTVLFRIQKVDTKTVTPTPCREAVEKFLPKSLEMASENLKPNPVTNNITTKDTAVSE